MPTCEPLQNQVTYITSFGVQNDAVNNHCDEIDNNLAQDLDLKINKSFKQDNYSLNVKRLRQDATESSPRSRRTASKSPSNETYNLNKLYLVLFRVEYKVKSLTSKKKGIFVCTLCIPFKIE